VLDMCYILCTTRTSFHVHFLVVFWKMVFTDGFLFPVKELGFLNNTGHSIRILDATRSYMYIIL
jgi:hypothetical protein